MDPSSRGELACRFVGECPLCSPADRDHGAGPFSDEILVRAARTFGSRAHGSQNTVRRSAPSARLNPAKLTVASPVHDLLPDVSLYY
jgi:hypothetical protein